MRRVLIAGPALGLLALAAPSGAAGALPFQVDALGPIKDVSAHWRQYQPASTFCIRPDAPQHTPGGSGATATGADPACRRSGFPRTARGLVKIHVRAPALCRGCARLFLDFARIPDGAGVARGHAYYHLSSPNPTYTVDPVAHSPNTKNFTNDKLIAPAGSPQEQIIGDFDRHAIAYVTDTAHFVHSRIQGPYYVGPRYLSRSGRWIRGAYLDVDVAGATELPSPSLNAIGYMAGFNTGRLCPGDDDALYAGCVDWWAISASTVNPFAG